MKKGIKWVVFTLMVLFTNCRLCMADDIYDVDPENPTRYEEVYSYEENNTTAGETIVNVVFTIIFLVLFAVSILSPFIIIVVMLNVAHKAIGNRRFNYDRASSTNGFTVNRKLNNKARERKVLYDDVDINVIRKYLPKYELYTLKKKLFDEYVQIQNAWMMFDYEMLKECCDQVLYNYYVNQLEILKSENGKNIIKDIELKECKILDVKEVYNSIYVTVYMDLSYYDYIVHNGNGAVTGGNANYKVYNSYILGFVKKKNSTSNSNCPNCGAVLDGDKKKCKYCGTSVGYVNQEFLLNKKKLVRK